MREMLRATSWEARHQLALDFVWPKRNSHVGCPRCGCQLPVKKFVAYHSPVFCAMLTAARRYECQPDAKALSQSLALAADWRLQVTRSFHLAHVTHSRYPDSCGVWYRCYLPVIAAG